MTVRLWTEKEDATLLNQRNAGLSWKNISPIVRRSANACYNRYVALTAKKAQQSLDEDPVLAKSIKYLRVMNYVTFRDGAEFICGTLRLNADELIAKAQRIKRNTEILARAAQ